jgi:predicted amidophosphoribosyltransferase
VRLASGGVHLLDLLLPQRCLVCSTAGAAVCDGCRGRLPRLRPPLCARCGTPTAWPVDRCRECAGRRLAFASSRAALAYDEAVRALVAGWKERGLRRLAVLAADLIVEELEPPCADVLAWVPADRDRWLLRGHHPPATLARELARRWELPAEPLLRRMRSAPRQRGLSLAKRRRNVAGAFVSAAAPPARVVVIDDVYTTGATAAAAASALRRAGARRVEILTFARTIRGR